MDLDDLLDFVAKSKTWIYINEDETLKIKSEGIREDTANGKREVFIIERKITDK